MSRIGKLPVVIPSGVDVDVADDHVRVKGPKGELVQPILRHVTVKLQGGELVVEAAKRLIRKALLPRGFAPRVPGAEDNHTPPPGFPIRVISSPRGETLS